MTAILGISAYYHDSAAALVVDGEIIAAAQEERFSRVKHDAGFPTRAVEYCLAEANLSASQLDYVGFYEKPLLKFDRLLSTYLSFAPAGFESFLTSMPQWLKQKLYLGRELGKRLSGYRRRFVFAEHHESHAASAFFPSPFDEAAILTVDGVGEWATATIGVGRGNRVELMREQRFPHSLGLLYSAFTYYCGFKVNGDEYKLMGLAPYGEPRYVERILEHLVDLKDDGSFRMDQSYFNYCQGLTMTGPRFDRLFGGAPRKLDGPIEQRHMDLAASIQAVTEEIMLRSARHAHALTGMKNLCLAGGVALNCVANGRILREGPFERIWIQPAADDAGGALGVALLIWHQLLGKPRPVQATDRQRGSLLGPTYADADVRAFLDSTGAPYDYVPDEDRLLDRVAGAIADGKVVAWFQDRMEFGPRALGARSILADARVAEMQSVVNLKVKFRESFRPFAPAALAEQAAEYFAIERGVESPYMLLVVPVRENRRRKGDDALAGLDRLKERRSDIPAVTHVDYSARVQTVDPGRHGRFRKLLERFHERTGCPAIVNTSFNLGWDPIVCSPRDAYETFMSSDIDVLCLGRFILEKPRQPAHGDEWLADLLRSPCHGAPLRALPDGAACAQCGHRFALDGGIWKLFWPHAHFDSSADVTRIVQQFYEENPFPNYDDHDSVRTLIEKARRGVYGRALDRAVPYNATVLEVGCGTGQLSNFLGIACRRVVATDLCLNSLRLGEGFRSRHELGRVRFIQMNLFKPCLREGSFDVILCNGVLHHTADPYGGFRSLLPLLKPGGHIVVGLYNRYGRLATDLRRQLFRLTGERLAWLDPVLRMLPAGKAKRAAWFADQYRHPHESKHTIGEVLRWFDESGLEFVRGVPSVIPEPDALEAIDLFAPTRRGSALEHALVQGGEIIAGAREGGFFVMIGRKPGESADTTRRGSSEPPLRAARSTG
jgi:carbamoyltransferase